MSNDSELREERQRRIAELEERLQRRGVGVRAPVAVFAMVVGGVLLGTFILANGALLLRGLRKNPT